MTRKTPLSRKLETALALCFFTTLFIACSQKSIEKSPGKDQGFSQNYAQGAINLKLTTSKKEISVAEQLVLVLEAAVPENMDVEFPAFAASLGDFGLVDSRVLPARLTGSGDASRVVHHASYILEPYLPGPYTIPAMTVTYRYRANNTGATELATEEMQITVKSLLAADAATAEIKDIRPPLSLPANRAMQLLPAAVLILLVVLAVTAFLYWKKIAAQKKLPELKLRPEEIALQELDRLLAEKLLARGETKLFHLRVSDIMRRYIENRFGVNAPERTTEEFLTELSQEKSPENALLADYKALLADFLTQCDLVKFARHKPTLAASEKTVVLCREFVEKTKGKGNYEL